MSWELFEDDPLMMTKQYFISNDDGSFTLATVEDQGTVLENNRLLRNQGSGVHEHWGEGQLVASIPMNLYWDLYQRGIVQDEAAMKRWLNSSENVVFRKRLGRV